MKRALRISCILLLTVLILLANTVFSVAEPADEAVDLSEVLTVLDQKHADYIGRLTDKVYNSCVSYAAGETVGVYGSTEMGYAFLGWHTKPASVKITWVDQDRKEVASQDWAPAQLDECVPDGGISMRVILHGLTDDIGNLVILAVIDRLHGMQYTTLYRLETILDSRYGTLEYHIRSIVQEPVLVHACQVILDGVVETVSHSLS